MTPLDNPTLPEQPLTSTDGLNWGSLIDLTLRQPRPLFKRIAAIPKLSRSVVLMALGILLCSSVVASLGEYVWHDQPLTDATWPVIGIMLGTATVWWSVVSALSWTAEAFTGVNRWRCLATLTALSGLPWLFYGPLALLKTTLPGIGPAFSPLLGLLLWGWQWALFGMAVAYSFHLTLKRTLAVLLAPLSLSIIWWIWLGQFFGSLGRVAP
ncbi:MAG: hypothetical protein U0003_05175 [Vampirovibrionales bacterium]